MCTMINVTFVAETDGYKRFITLRFSIIKGPIIITDIHKKPRAIELVNLQSVDTTHYNALPNHRCTTSSA